jgi:hypothetical protein
MRKSLLIIPVLFLLLFAATVLRASDITYTVNQTVGIGSMTGTITTDGVIGTLAIADTVGWNLTINDGTATLLLTPSDSTVQGIGSALSASPTGLTYNYSIGDTVIDFYGFDPNGGGVGDWVSLAAPQDKGLFQIFNLNGDGVDLSTATVGLRTGSQVIATVSAVPEPGTFGLMMIGLGSLGLVVVMRRRIAWGHAQTA